MIAALNTWISDKLQPAAKKSFGSPIARVLAGSYSCRNRYGLARAPISEHAYMNAIDISGFVLENGKVIRVSKSWAPPKDEEAVGTRRNRPVRTVRGAKPVTVVAVRLGPRRLTQTMKATSQKPNLKKRKSRRKIRHPNFCMWRIMKLARYSEPSWPRRQRRAPRSLPSRHERAEVPFNLPIKFSL